MESKVEAVLLEPRNKAKFVGQEAPLKLEHIRALRVRLQMEERVCELALFKSLRADRDLIEELCGSIGQLAVPHARPESQLPGASRAHDPGRERPLATGSDPVSQSGAAADVAPAPPRLHGSGPAFACATATRAAGAARR
jgi:hypothetical protein